MHKSYRAVKVNEAIRLKIASKEFLTEEQEAHLMRMHKVIVALSPDALEGNVNIDIEELEMLGRHL